MNVLSVQHLTKRYGSITALDGVSFEVPQGSIFGILGPNGSGKTTTLGVVTDVLKATQGSYQYFGSMPTALHRKRIGTLLETPNFYHYLSAVENLRISANIKGRGLEDIPAVLQRVNLFERKDSAFSTFSLGMKQRLAIGAALLGNPDVLILDEPTNGLDPVGITEIRELIKSLRAEGKTIIMASHLLDEVEKVCTHMVVLKKGKVITEGRVNDILAQGDSVEAGATGQPGLASCLRSYPGVHKVEELPTGHVLAYFEEKEVAMGKVNAYCFAQGITLDFLAPKRKSLETRFLELTEDNKTTYAKAAQH